MKHFQNCEVYNLQNFLEEFTDVTLATPLHHNFDDLYSVEFNQYITGTTA